MNNPKKIDEQDTDAKKGRAKSAATLAVYFTDETGQRYRVYDTTFSKGKHRQHPLGDPAATTRVFVLPSREEMLRTYLFKKGESRVLDTQTLTRQLRDAEYAPREMPDNSHLMPW